MAVTLLMDNHLEEITFGVLSDENDVNVVVSGFDSLSRLAMEDIDEEIERVSQLNIPRF